MAVVTFIKQHIATTNASTYTFSSTSTGGANDVGATASDRQIIIGASIAATATAARTISSVTAGGLTMTNPVVKSGTRTSTATSISRSLCNGMYHVLFASATTANVVITATTTVSNSCVAIWSATEIAATATFGMTFPTASGFASATNGSMTATIGTSGAIFFHSINTDSGSAINWSTATAVFDTVVESTFNRHSAAMSQVSGTTTAQPTTVNFYGVMFLAFDSLATAGGGGETLYRTFLPMHTSPVGHRQMMTSIREAFYEWCPV